MSLRLPKITIWRAIFPAVLLSDLYATYLRIFYGLGGSTNLSDRVPWGIWIAFDILCGVGLAAGGFTLVAVVHIFNIERYKPILRPAILTAFLGYSLVVVALLFDLGRPDRLWHPLVMWNPHSVIFEVARCVMLYTTVLFLEFLPMVFEKFGWHRPRSWIHNISVPLMIAGVQLSTLHQSSLGSLFLIVPEKMYPLRYSPTLPAQFYISAIGVGLAMTIFESWHSSRAFGRALELALLASMGRVLAVLMSVYLCLRLLDLAHRGGFALLLRNRLTKLNRPDRARIFTDKQGDRVLGVIRPIENSAACYKAACHVHPASQRVLGVVDANLSLAMVDAPMAQHQATLVWFLIGAITIGPLTAVLFIWVVVYRPVQELIRGTHRVAGGDLVYRLPVRSDDELGDLAASFNKMTAEVAGEQSRIEEQVRRKTAELERVYKTLLSTEKLASIGKLAATVAHEINNPLFGILTYSRLVRRELGKQQFAGREDLATQLETIERESKRCGDLVKNLLTFGRQAPSHREPNDLNVVVRRAVALVKHKLDLQNVELLETLAADLPPVECDANQMQQVLIVLLVNASEAMPKGGTVSLSTALDPATDRMLVRVKDTASGIPEDVLPHIFEPFFTTKQDQLRTGLGLAVAHSIAEQHGGEISVQSTPGKGTEFSVALPAYAAGCAMGPPVETVISGKS